MDPSQRIPSRIPPGVRVTVLLRLLIEGYQDAFERKPEWLELPAADLAELNDAVGADHAAELVDATGLRQGGNYTAGGPLGMVTLAPAAHNGLLGLLGLAAIPPNVIIEHTPDGPRYAVPDDWFVVAPSLDGHG
jgi:hypothetical protein